MKSNVLRIAIVSIVIVSSVVACKPKQSSVTDSNESKFVGTWVEPNPIDSSAVQGVKLEAKGVASSVNMHTLRYSKWSLTSDGQLELSSVSEGSGEPVDCVDTYTVVKVDQDSLVLSSSNGIVLRYGRAE